MPARPGHEGDHAQPRRSLAGDYNSLWNARSQVWKSGFRNLHSQADPEIEVELLVPGESQPTVIRREWTGDGAQAELRALRRMAELTGPEAQPYGGSGTSLPPAP
ncbi:hypothetical protein [Streptosporangium canum]|uniref:hypothetical protein n=1 Tax=Streptosporangium canum TaxID=324952 RepID=UPI00378E7011